MVDYSWAMRNFIYEWREDNWGNVALCHGWATSKWAKITHHFFIHKTRFSLVDSTIKFPLNSTHSKNMKNFMVNSKSFVSQKLIMKFDNTLRIINISLLQSTKKRKWNECAKKKVQRTAIIICHNYFYVFLLALQLQLDGRLGFSHTGTVGALVWLSIVCFYFITSKQRESEMEWQERWKVLSHQESSHVSAKCRELSE